MTTSLSLMNSVVFLAALFLSCTHWSLYTSIRVLSMFSALPGYLSSSVRTTTDVCLPDTLAFRFWAYAFAFALLLTHETVMSSFQLSAYIDGIMAIEPTGVDRVSPRAPSMVVFFSLSGPMVKSVSTNVLSLPFSTTKENDDITSGSIMDSSIGELL